MIKTVIFDMGGVVITLDENEAGKRFVELGMKEFAEKMDPYKQSGLNGDLEEGKLSEEEYRRQVSEKVGRAAALLAGLYEGGACPQVDDHQKSQEAGVSRGLAQQYQSIRIGLDG